ncbi:MAG TPA: hypothetical protein PLR32_06170 [candidate division Zixibacteria bacterium]|nr:hypothetical protein [candidate division Zixibacteria bacterium]MDD4918318.1 hypothetical protein [candidate division Zixibacteria bacterium]MDM7974024.1 hypothetical protein [candidate division Zixibacteria bacterium]HOD67659.1 hypothetical protein [candidate division Zixibacteria bacterium]HPI32882.1 hypothetical protein [candidate division Zixibacteria bacterium]
MNLIRLAVIGLMAAPAVLPLAAQQSADKTSKPSGALAWETLAEFLPESIPGYTAGEPTGGSRAVEDPASPERSITHSSVRRSYIRETAEGEQSFINVTIVDAGRSRLVLDPFLPELSFVPSDDRQTVEIKGRRATQIIEYGESDIALGLVYVLVEERLAVIVQGEGVRDMDEVRGVAGAIDFEGLEKAMKAKK